MSLQWFTPRNDPTWCSKSADGYYAISSIEGAEPDSVRRFEAFHIEALWARPAAIGWGSDVRGAQRICEQHRERNGAPA